MDMAFPLMASTILYGRNNNNQTGGPSPLLKYLIVYRMGQNALKRRQELAAKQQTHTKEQQVVKPVDTLDIKKKASFQRNQRLLFKLAGGYNYFSNRSADLPPGPPRRSMNSRVQNFYSVNARTNERLSRGSVNMTPPPSYKHMFAMHNGQLAAVNERLYGQFCNDPNVPADLKLLARRYYTQFKGRLERNRQAPSYVFPLTQTYDTNPDFTLQPPLYYQNMLGDING